MHLERTGRTQHEMVEVYDHTHCRACGLPLAPPRVALGMAGCSCAARRHRSRTCLPCREVHVETTGPSCQLAEHDILGGHRRADHEDD